MDRSSRDDRHSRFGSGSEMTHRYMGPSNGFGLKHGTPCAILYVQNTQAGMKQARIQREDGRQFMVRRSQVEVATA